MVSYDQDRRRQARQNAVVRPRRLPFGNARPVTFRFRAATGTAAVGVRQRGRLVSSRSNEQKAGWQRSHHPVTLVEQKKVR
jgi:hypothetical protein